MYSENSLRYMAREHRRLVVQRVRQGILTAILIGVSIWGLQQYLADHHTFAWDEPVSVAVVALVDEESGVMESGWYVQSFLTRAAAPWHNLKEVEKWLQEEYERLGGDNAAAFEFSVRGPVRLETPPPQLPAASDSFLDRLSGSRQFLNYFSEIAERDELLLGQYDVNLFVYFYDPDDEERAMMFSRFDSMASRRSRIGIVFAPMSREQRGHTCAVVAHELLHVLGASDKYDGNRSIFPGGYAEPDREPRYPQRRAEIMALGIPQSPSEDLDVRELSECVVGDATAQEINWPGSGH